MEKCTPSAITPAREILPGLPIQPLLTPTTSGQVEFALAGAGNTVVLSVHGGVGGCDQGLLMTHWIDTTRFRILSPSRPGYLGTPLDSGETMQQQADMLAALLDALDIEKAIVVAASAGGPPAYQFAIRHPGRVRGLVVIDAISGLYEMPVTAGPLIRAIFLSDTGQKLQQKMMQWAPRASLESTFKAESYFNKAQLEEHVAAVMKDARLLEFIRAFMDCMQPYRLRKAGTENDMAQFLKFDHLPVEKVQCPTLVIHGTHDADVMFHQGVYAFEHIHGAQRFWIEEGSHLDFWVGPSHQAAQYAAHQFLESCLISNI